MSSALLDAIKKLNFNFPGDDHATHLANARALIAQGVDLEVRDFNGRTALHAVVKECACGGESIALANELLDAGARPHNVDDNGMSLLAELTGAKGSNFDDPENNALLFELAKRLAALGAPLDEGKISPLLHALTLNRVELAWWLLEQGAHALGTYVGRDPITYVASQTRLPVAFIPALQESGVALEPDALLVAIKLGHTEAIDALTDLGLTADPDHVGEDGYTFLHAAAEAGDLARVEAFLATRPRKKVIDAKTTRRKRTALVLAIAKGHEDVARRLLEAKAKVKGGDADRYTALHHAAEANLADLIPVLLERGAEPDKVNYSRECALFRAAFHGHVEAARALMGCADFQKPRFEQL